MPTSWRGRSPVVVLHELLHRVSEAPLAGDAVVVEALRAERMHSTLGAGAHARGARAVAFHRRSLGREYRVEAFAEFLVAIDD